MNDARLLIVVWRDESKETAQFEVKTVEAADGVLAFEETNGDMRMYPLDLIGEAVCTALPKGDPAPTGMKEV